jgi:nitrogen fixation NifU-like protein
MVNDLAQLYLAEIKKHAADPVGFQQDIEVTHQHEEYNPLCGDRILLQLQIEAGRIEAAAFDGEACTICLASTSLLCEHVPGKTVENLLSLKDQLVDSLESGEGAPELDALTPLMGVRPYPSRVQCATLPWKAASSACVTKI